MRDRPACHQTFVHVRSTSQRERYRHTHALSLSLSHVFISRLAFTVSEAYPHHRVTIERTKPNTDPAIGEGNRHEDSIATHLRGGWQEGASLQSH